MCIPEIRCPWVDLSKPDYVKYHDTEWGVPVHDDRLLFEFLILEAFQAGLSWYTILKRRKSFREAFDDFDPGVMLNFSIPANGLSIWLIFCFFPALLLYSHC